ncbi:MAG TPA: hypothetical protein PKC19_11125, partial [Roseiflexaceae bacterium]|nr:hypothetical protein [Roseiflexaceae bacterium]
MQSVPTPGSTAILCGSRGALGAAVCAKLQQLGVRLITIDPLGTPVHPAATYHLCGDLAHEAEWQRLAGELATLDCAATMLICLSDAVDHEAPALDLAAVAWDAMFEQQVRRAFLATRWLLPLLQPPAAVVLTASMLGSHDTRADMAALAASSAGV